jgi:hypothetical protein
MFKSGKAIATATVVLLAVQAVMLVGGSIGWWYVGSIPDPLSRLETVGVVGLLELAWIAVFIATAVTFSIWIHRAMSNLPALGSMSSRFTPAGAVWAFYIPFVNLVRGHQVMATIWSESQPAPMTEAGFIKPRSTAIVNAWWALWVGGRVLDYVLSKVLDDFSALAHSEAFFKLVMATAATLCLIMVRKADERQQAMWDDIQRRANVPQPTGAELR